MKLWLPRTILSLLLAVGVSGCDADPVALEPPSDWHENIVPDQPGVRVVDLSTGFSDPARLVVRDQDTWVALWEAWTRPGASASAPPAVDFATEMVLVAAMGSRPSGGYAIGIDTIAESADAIAVHVFTVSPGPGCIVTLAITSPAIAVAMPTSPKPVTFTTTEYVQDCT